MTSMRIILYQSPMCLLCLARILLMVPQTQAPARPHPQMTVKMTLTIMTMRLISLKPYHRRTRNGDTIVRLLLEMTHPPPRDPPRLLLLPPPWPTSVSLNLGPGPSPWTSVSRITSPQGRCWANSRPDRT
uniref:Secreted protein n=1 Tax=Cacopsylla melanoneura TaxID=428564 RepID=A0A8D8YNR0_9HEMI